MPVEKTEGPPGTATTPAVTDEFGLPPKSDADGTAKPVDDPDAKTKGESKTDESVKTSETTSTEAATDKSKEKSKETTSDDSSKTITDGDEKFTDSLDDYKYKTIQEFKKGHHNLTQLSDTLKAENKDFREKMTAYEANQETEKTAYDAKMLELTETIGRINTDGKAELTDMPFFKSLTEKNPGLAKHIEELQSAVGGDGANALASIMEAIGKQNTAETEQIKQQNEAREAEIQNVEYDRQFAEKFPASKDETVAKAMGEIKDAFGKPEFINDPLAIREVVYNAARGRNIDNLIKAGIEKQLPDLVKEGVKKAIAGGAVIGGPTGGGAGTKEEITKQADIDWGKVNK